MSKQKQPIPISKITKLTEMLGVIAESMRIAEKQFHDAGMEQTMMEGWPTLKTSIGHVVNQCIKFTGPISPLARVDVDELEIDDAADDAKLTASELEKLKVAEAKANYRRPKKSPGSRE